MSVIGGLIMELYEFFNSLKWSNYKLLKYKIITIKEAVRKILKPKPIMHSIPPY